MQDYLEGKIDFVGQQRVEEVARVVLISTTALSFIVGFAMQSLAVTFGIFGAVTAVLLLAVVPPWPMFRQHPVRWLGARASN
ncbi:hypothetical protein P691DRAFT_763508 [Macrolepiota fuliginosa MF-IS2]|uniref:Signal peptidase complex subunit 1 n=1 Tax=Macrolepiota fuliginosa MF-IS2 TaxID=1400762 RepID=A0A9P6C080_9AGAR|nr:hypothetical protein P691DRAFT_763508 [Macrolepiota fuliginosa MF-IS2]